MQRPGAPGRARLDWGWGMDTTRAQQRHDTGKRGHDVRLRANAPPNPPLPPHHHSTPHHTTSHHTKPHHTTPHHTTSHHTSTENKTCPRHPPLPLLLIEPRTTHCTTLDTQNGASTSRIGPPKENPGQNHQAQVQNTRVLSVPTTTRCPRIPGGWCVRVRARVGLLCVRVEGSVHATA